MSNSKRRGTRVLDADRHVGRRMRDRRVMLGLTQQQTAPLIGVTYQQLHKYETGINRVAAGRLHTIAQALGVDVGYLFEGFGADPVVPEITANQRLFLELAQDFAELPRRHQEAICILARALSPAEETNNIAVFKRHLRGRHGV